MPEIPAPIMWPTVDPTATPAAVEAICANIPGCLPWTAGVPACWTAGGGGGAVRAGTEAVEAARDWVGRAAGRAAGRAPPLWRAIVNV